MIVDVYDMTATLSCSRYKVDEKQCRIQLVERKRFSDVLIYPHASKNRNQPPYVQDWERPIIRDLVDEYGEFHGDNCSFLPDFFQQEKQDVRKIADFFNALKVSSYRFDQSADHNVILIPDNFDATLQEHILRSCALPREKTCLLWRSVAICLGNADKANHWHDKMEITDCQRIYEDTVTLEIFREDGFIVPQRKAYKPQGGMYGHQLRKDADLFAGSKEFYRRTYCGGPMQDVVIWNAERKQFERAAFEQKTGIKVSVRFDEGGSDNRLFFPKMDAEEFSASDGGAIYIARKEGGKPTYYDECTGLYIVVQDFDTERVYAEELIAPNPKYKGGEEIKGKENKDFSIDKGSDLVGFRLADEKGDDVHLKKLEYTFRIGATKYREPLTLYPSMKPGQGIARVLVTGEKQLTETVELDLLKMEWTDPKETVKSLRDNLDRSFPIDIPAVTANSCFWQKKVRDRVGGYLQDRKKRDPRMFSSMRYPKSGSQDVLERMERTNVFGWHKLPDDKTFDFDELFEAMARDYEECRNDSKKGEADNVLAMISLTYQGSNKHFKKIKEDILEDIKNFAANGKPTISKRKMTACAYLFRNFKELEYFFDYYLKILCKANKDKKFSGLTDWYRVMADLLMINSDMLGRISTEKCEKCMENLLSPLTYYHENNHPNTIFYVLKVCLFLLTRRKYDKAFLREGDLFLDAKGSLEVVQKGTENAKVESWCSIVLKFMQGKGRLEDLPIAVEDNKEEKDDE